MKPKIRGPIGLWTVEHTETFHFSYGFHDEAEARASFEQRKKDHEAAPDRFGPPALIAPAKRRFRILRQNELFRRDKEAGIVEYESTVLLEADNDDQAASFARKRWPLAWRDGRVKIEEVNA